MHRGTSESAFFEQPAPTIVEIHAPFLRIEQRRGANSSAKKFTFNMSSADKQSDVATKRAEESIPDKEKGTGDVKSDTSPHKRSASEINSADDGEVKQKVLKTDHKGKEGKDKENGESEDKYDEGDGDDDDEDVVPEGEGEDYDDEGDEDGAEEDDDDEDDA